MEILQAKLTKGERDVLRIVRQNPDCTQADLTRQLDIVQQSISRIIGGLTDRGLLCIGEPVSQGRRGKPSPLLTLRADAGWAVGISIMADSVATGLIDFSGALRGRESAHIPDMAVEAVMAEIERQLNLLLAKNRLSRTDLIGAGVAMTGYFMGEERRFNPPEPLRHWMDVDIATTVSARLNLPCWADNDGNAAAIGEAALGVGRRIKNFAYLYFSTGFGGGVITEGKLLTGRFGNSGEFAGIIPFDGFTHPNLETLRQELAEHNMSLPSIYALVAQFDPDWPGVAQWRAKVRGSLSLVASACSAILDTEALVLGGLLPRSLAELLIADIEFYSLPRWGVRRPVPVILPAEAPGEATLFGAASMPLEQLFF